MDLNDEKIVDRKVLDQIVEALGDVVFPRFDILEQGLEEVKKEVGGLKSEMGEMKLGVSSLGDDVKLLGESVDNLENDMVGVKMRLTSIEKKMDDKLDIASEVKGHDKRITRLEKAVI